MNYTTIAQYLTEQEAIAQLRSLSLKQLAAIYNHTIDNPDEPSHNFSISKHNKLEPTAFLSDEVLILDLDPNDFLLIEPEIIEAIRIVEAERDRIWKKALARADMRQEVLNTSAA